MTTLIENQTVEQIPSSEEWEFKFVEDFSRGINVSLYPQRIDEQQLLTAENIRDERGRLVLTYGNEAFGPTVRGAPRAVYQVFFKNGTSKLTLITNATFYEWTSTPQEWWYVSDGVSTTIGTGGSATDTSIDVADITGFSDGDYIGIVMDDGTQHQTTVDGAPAGTTINIDDALPSATANGNAVVKAVDLTGSDDVQVSITTWAAFDKMYFANGVDVPQQYDGTTCEDISNLPATTFACRIVVVYLDYLMLMHTVEDGTAYPQRYRWCQPADPTDWNESVNFKDLYRTEDWIVASEGLGPYQIIYKERSIVRTEFVGDVGNTFDDVTTIKSEGALTQDSVVDLGEEHMFFGNANIYTYDAGFSIKPTGDKIWEDLFGNVGRLNPGERVKSFVLYIEETDETYFIYPAGDDEYPMSAFVQKGASTGWVTREFGIQITGFGFYSRENTITWNDAQGTWEEAQGPWIGSQLQANSPTTLLCGWDGVDGQVYQIDYTATDDNGTAIAYELETRDFYYPNRFIRTNRFDFKLAGSSIKIEYSTDEGDTWEVFKDDQGNNLGPFSPGATLTKVSIHQQVHCRTIRFRLSGSAGFGLQWFAFVWKRESIW